MDDLAGEEPFSAHANEIRRALDRASIVVGYNLRFDLDMLQAEFHRLHQRPADLANKHLVDPLKIWKQCEPRTLEAAHERFVGKAMIGAHGAQADTAATARVLGGMLRSFGLENESWDEIADLCEPDRHLWIGPSHHIQWRNDAPTLMFGRHASTPLSKLAARKDGDYLRWILRRDFPPHVNEISIKALQLSPNALRAWIVRTYGPAAPEQPRSAARRRKVSSDVSDATPPTASSARKRGLSSFAASSPRASGA